MTIKKNQAVMLSVVVFFLVLIFGIRFLTPEDEWICKDGTWMAHGKPESPKPIIACSENNNSIESDDTYCEQNEDCACGGHISKGNCFLGNKRFIDASKQCSKMCPEDIKIQCVKNKCQQANN
jgi:hypothetical protein